MAPGYIGILIWAFPAPRIVRVSIYGLSLQAYGNLLCHPDMFAMTH